MPRRKSTGLTDRSVVSHGANGKGDASRITDMRAYHENFAAIDWKNTSRKKTKTLRELEDEYEFRHGL